MTFIYFYFRLQHARTPRIFPCQRPRTYSWHPSRRQWCKSPNFACYSFLTLSIARAVSHLDSDHRYSSHHNANHDHPSCGGSKYFGWIGTSYVLHGWCKRCVYWRADVNYTLWVHQKNRHIVIAVFISYMLCPGSPWDEVSWFSNLVVCQLF